MQDENKLFIFLIFDVFHLEMSGKDFNNGHVENNPFIFVIFFKFHFAISGNLVKDLQFENIN